MYFIYCSIFHIQVERPLIFYALMWRVADQTEQQGRLFFVEILRVQSKEITTKNKTDDFISKHS